MRPAAALLLLSACLTTASLRPSRGRLGGGLAASRPPPSRLPALRHTRPSFKDDTAILTISATNDVHRVRNFMATAVEHNPVSDRFWCAYALRRDIEAAHESKDYTTMAVDELGIVNAHNPLFWYPVVDGSTYVKPYCIHRVFTAFNRSRLLYFDNDVMLFQPMDDLFAQLKNHTFVVTPHMLQPAPDDGKHVSDFDILLAGNFNLGFMGLSNTALGASFLMWWMRKVYEKAFNDPAHGMMSDQKWIDMVPVLFGDVHVVRDPTYNAAYWNMHERGDAIVFESPSKITLGGRPLHFFHFSGYDFTVPAVLSRHQNRYTFESVPNLQPLFAMYADRLKHFRHRLGSPPEDPFSRFDNGLLIGRGIKKFLAQAPYTFRQAVVNPFHTSPASNASFTYLDYVTDNACNRTRFVSNILLIAAATCPRLLLYRYGLCSESYDEYIAYRSALACLGLRDSRALQWSLSRQSFRWVRVPRQYDVVLNGYMSGQFGVGQGGRMLGKALAAAGTSVKYVTLRSLVPDVSDDALTGMSPATGPGAFNIFHVNADQAKVTSEWFWAHFPDRNPLHSFNIGVWYWELEEFPAELWPEATTNLTEVWVASSFIEKAVAAKLTVPVYRFVPPFPVARPGPFSLRQHLGIKRTATLFFFNFDYTSCHRRKNPDGAVAAFKQAFQNNDNVALVIKAVRANYSAAAAKHWQSLTTLAAPHTRIHLMTDHLPQADMEALYHDIDCYVSLHRSEGLGQGMQTAMAIGKPVIATAYSGNMDFMSHDTAFLVNHTRVAVGEDWGPYRSANVWAEPDVGHAAALMRHVHFNKSDASAVGVKANRAMQECCSPALSAVSVQKRLAMLKKFADEGRATVEVTDSGWQV